MKYLDYKIVFKEHPKYISLLFEITNCPIGCINCHTPELQKDIGQELTPEILERVLIEYKNFVDNIIFFGGYHDNENLKILLEICKNYGYYTTLWTGFDEVDNETKKLLDYLKTGHYDEKLGGLDNPNTNQKYINVKTGEKIKI